MGALMDDARRYRKVAEHADAGCRTLHRFADGWTAREYVTPSAVRAMGVAMANCWQYVDDAMALPAYEYAIYDTEAHRYACLHEADGRPRLAFYIVADPRSDGPLRVATPARVANGSPLLSDAQRFEAWNRAYGHAEPARILHFDEWLPFTSRAVLQFWFDDFDRDWYTPDGRVRVYHPTRAGATVAFGALWVSPVLELALARQAPDGFILEVWVDADRLGPSGTEDEFMIVGIAPGELRAESGLAIEAVS